MGVNEKIETINRELDSAGDTLNYLDNNPKVFIAILIIILVIFVVILFTLLIFNPNDEKSKLEKKLKTKKKNSKIPCNGDLYVTYLIASKCNLVDYLSIKGNLISSFYLKWLKKGLLKIQAADKDDNQAVLYFDDNFVNCLDDEIEAELYTISKKALLIAKANYFKADDLINTLSDEKIGLTAFFVHVYYKAKKRIEAQVLPLGENSVRNKRLLVEERMLSLKEEVVEFMNFIKDEAMVKDYEFESVHIWDNYYIFANLLGLRKNMKPGWFNDKINQNFIEISKTSTFDNINEFVHNEEIYSVDEMLNHKNKIIKSQKNYVRLLNESSKY